MAKIRRALLQVLGGLQLDIVGVFFFKLAGRINGGIKQFVEVYLAGR
jgi:uncharacterized membrane protein YuzA (DUF378 family)